MGRPRNPERDKSMQRYLDADGKIETAELAKLAGVPDSVIERAKQIVEELSANDITAVTKNLAVETGTKKKKEKLDEVDLAQMSLFDTVKDDDILEELKNVDLSNMTPIDALNKLYELQNKIKNRW